jgi:hypothetical protein
MLDEYRTSQGKLEYFIGTREAPLIGDETAVCKMYVFSNT